MATAPKKIPIVLHTASEEQGQRMVLRKQASLVYWPRAETADIFDQKWIWNTEIKEYFPNIQSVNTFNSKRRNNPTMFLYAWKATSFFSVGMAAICFCELNLIVKWNELAAKCCLWSFGRKMPMLLAHTWFYGSFWREITNASRCRMTSSATTRKGKNNSLGFPSLDTNHWEVQQLRTTNRFLENLESLIIGDLLVHNHLGHHENKATVFSKFLLLCVVLRSVHQYRTYSTIPVDNESSRSLVQ